VHWDGTAWTRVTAPIQFGSLNTIAPDDQGRPRWISHTAFNLAPPAQAQYLSFDLPGTEATWAAGSATVTGGSVPRIELSDTMTGQTCK
jgi:hypothetical protein